MGSNAITKRLSVFVIMKRNCLGLVNLMNFTFCPDNNSKTILDKITYLLRHFLIFKYLKKFHFPCHVFKDFIHICTKIILTI